MIEYFTPILIVEPSEELEKKRKEKLAATKKAQKERRDSRVAVVLRLIKIF